MSKSFFNPLPLAQDVIEVFKTVSSVCFGFSGQTLLSFDDVGHTYPVLSYSSRFMG